MPHMNIAMPIIPGQENDARDLAKEVAGPRRDDYASFQLPSGTSRETWTLQETPAGMFLLVWFDADDIEMGLRDLAHGDDDFTTWFRNRIETITGVGMGDGVGPLSEPLLDWSA
jgi:hypothetical protein